MESFDLKINRTIFRSTNAVWNELQLNSPWSVGYVSTLIESQPFLSKEAWQQFYFDSGEKRRVLLEKLSVQQRQQLCNLSLAKSANDIPNSLKKLNFQYGRTKEELREKAHRLCTTMHKKGSNITFRECIHCVHHRVIAETWNGIILRERNTIRQLQLIFPFHFKKATGAFDHQYAVDYEIFEKEKLIAAIQIKPASYLRQVFYINKARQANISKNKKYTNRFGVPVFDVIADQNGRVQNAEVIEELRRCMLL